MPTYIRTDRKAQYEKQATEIMEYLSGTPETIPVDLNGARTDFIKVSPTANVEKAQEDIRRRFDMNLPITREDKEGGEI